MMGAGFVGGIAARAAGAISDPILGAIAGPSIQAAGQVGGELAGTLGQSISKFAFGDSPAEARAGSQAREETIAAYGYSEGRRGGRPSDAAKAYFDSRMRQLEPAEKGRTAIEGDKRFRGATLESIANNGGVAAVVAGVGNELMKAADRIVEGMRGFFNGGR
jgi:hypothetical protein